APPSDGVDGESITTTSNTFPHPISSRARAPASAQRRRPCKVTQEFNQNQRFNRLAFSTTSDGTGLSVTAPSDPNLCPPGHYMLVIVNSASMASIAAIVNIG